jgi:hypothetical protein
VPGWWLELHCACGRVMPLPVKLLIRRFGPDAELSPLVARLRCERCGRPPATA